MEDLLRGRRDGRGDTPAIRRGRAAWQRDIAQCRCGPFESWWWKGRFSFWFLEQRIHFGKSQDISNRRGNSCKTNRNAQALRMFAGAGQETDSGAVDESHFGKVDGDTVLQASRGDEFRFYLEPDFLGVGGGDFPPPEQRETVMKRIGVVAQFGFLGPLPNEFLGGMNILSNEEIPAEPHEAERASDGWAGFEQEQKESTLLKLLVEMHEQPNGGAVDGLHVSQIQQKMVPGT